MGPVLPMPEGCMPGACKDPASPTQQNQQETGLLPDLQSYCGHVKLATLCSNFVTVWCWAIIGTTNSLPLQPCT